MAPVAAKDLVGVCVVGKLAATVGPDGVQPVLSIEVPRGESSWTHRIDYRRFRESDGSPTEIGKAVADAALGSWVAVRVIPRPHAAGVSKAGKEYPAFVSFYALALVPLSVA